MRGIATHHNLNLYRSLCVVTSCVFTTTSNDVFGLKHISFGSPIRRRIDTRVYGPPTGLFVEKAGKTAATATSANARRSPDLMAAASGTSLPHSM